MRRRGSSPFGTVLPTLLFWWGNPLVSPSCLSRHLRLKVRLKRGGSISYFTPSPAKNTVFKVNFVHYLTFSLPEWWGKVISPFQVPALFQHCNYNTGHTDWTKQSFWIVELLFFWAKAGRQQMNTYVRWWECHEERDVGRENEMQFAKEGGGVWDPVSDGVVLSRNRIPLGLQRHILWPFPQVLKIIPQ